MPLHSTMIGDTAMTSAPRIGPVEDKLLVLLARYVRARPISSPATRRAQLAPPRPHGPGAPGRARLRRRAQGLFPGRQSARSSTRRRWRAGATSRSTTGCRSRARWKPSETRLTDYRDYLHDLAITDTGIAIERFCRKADPYVTLVQLPPRPLPAADEDPAPRRYEPGDPARCFCGAAHPARRHRPQEAALPPDRNRPGHPLQSGAPQKAPAATALRPGRPLPARLRDRIPPTSGSARTGMSGPTTCAAAETRSRNSTRPICARFFSSPRGSGDDRPGRPLYQALLDRAVRPGAGQPLAFPTAGHHSPRSQPLPPARSYDRFLQVTGEDPMRLAPNSTCPDSPLSFGSFLLNWRFSPFPLPLLACGQERPLVVAAANESFEATIPPAAEPPARVPRPELACGGIVAGQGRRPWWVSRPAASSAALRPCG